MLGAPLFVLPPAGNGVPPRPDSGASGPQPGGIHATPILIVEDEAMIAWMIEDVLAAAGFSTIALAATGEQAEALAAAERPGIVISDINLGGGKDGIAAAVQIRGTSRLPLIFVTAYADDAIRARLAEALPGAQLLRKPVDEAALLRAVMRALGN